MIIIYFYIIPMLISWGLIKLMNITDSVEQYTLEFWFISSLFPVINLILPIVIITTMLVSLLKNIKTFNTFFSKILKMASNIMNWVINK